MAQLGARLGPNPSWGTNVNILQLGSEIPSLHSKSEPNFVHTEDSGQAWLRSPELSQCEMLHYLIVSHLWDNSSPSLYIGNREFLVRSVSCYSTQFYWQHSIPGLIQYSGVYLTSVGPHFSLPLTISYLWLGPIIHWSSNITPRISGQGIFCPWLSVNILLVNPEQWFQSTIIIN